MGWIMKCIRVFSLLIICILSYIKCDGELVIIHSPDIINFYDERPLYVSELKFVFGTCLGYLQAKSAEWQDLHLSRPYDYYNIVFMVAVVPGVETLNVTGKIRIPLIEDDDLNKTYSELDLKTTTLFKHYPLNGRARRFNLAKLELSDSDMTSSPLMDSAYKFYETVEADMLKPLNDAGPYIYWGDYPYFHETDPEYLQQAQTLMSTSMQTLAQIVKPPRKALVALITHSGKIHLTRRKREIEKRF